MKKVSVSHIRRWLVLFLAMVILTAMATYLLAYVEITGTLKGQFLLSGTQSGSTIQENNPDHLSGLKIRLLLLLSGAVAVLFLLGYLWIEIASRQLNRPLRTISKAITRLSKGKLNATVSVDAEEEYVQIADGINELSANMQELLLYVWNQSGKCLSQLEQLKSNATDDDNGHRPAIHLDQIQQMIKSVDDLRKMAKAYVFYDVHLDGENTLSISEPGHAKSSDNEHPTPLDNQ